MRLQALPTYRLILTGHSLSQVCVGTRKLVELRYTGTHICLYVRLIVDYWYREKLERQASAVGGEGEP